MGITAKEILEELANLVDSVKYWKQCQPHLVPEDLETSLNLLIAKIEAMNVN